MDTEEEDRQPIDLWVVFRELPAAHKSSVWWKLLQPGFAHCEVWRNIREVWIRCEPCLELAELEVYENPPWKLILPELQPTFVRVQRAAILGKVRDFWQLGPSTCVELTKAFLGVNAPFVRTPYQLYKALLGNRWDSRSTRL